MNTTLTHELLKTKLRYDEKTGIFYWKSGTRLAFQPAGHIDNTGYIRIRMVGRLWQAHVLAWFYVYGELPSGSIDHIDRNKLNNRIENLRVALQGTQNYNTKLRSDSTSGIRGVSLCNFTNKWKAYFSAAGKTKTLGRYDTKEEAALARQLYQEEWEKKQNV